jgi:hypothetical protein
MSRMRTVYAYIHTCDTQALRSTCTLQIPHPRTRKSAHVCMYLAWGQRYAHVLCGHMMKSSMYTRTRDCFACKWHLWNQPQQSLPALHTVRRKCLGAAAYWLGACNPRWKRSCKAKESYVARVSKRSHRVSS